MPISNLVHFAQNWNDGVLEYWNNDLPGFWLAEPIARREERAEWTIFFKKRVLFEWFRDRSCWGEAESEEPRKNRRIPKHFNKKKNVALKLNQLILYRKQFFLYDPLSTSLHGF